jgi:hypothetical protein
VPLPYPLGLAGLGQPVAAVGGHRLQQAVARAVGAVRDHDERTVDKPGEQPRHVGRGDRAGLAAHLLGRLQRAAVGVHGQAPQHDAFRLGEQVPAPVDHCGQRLLARGRVPAAGRQQPEPVVQPGHQLADAERPDPRRGQLQRQRYPVEPPAQLGDRGSGLRVEREPSRRRGRPGHEQPYGRRPGHLRGVSARRGIGHVERRDGPDHLCGQAERFPAGRQDAQPRTAAQQPPGQLRGLVDDVLAVVQDEQHSPGPQRLDEPVARTRDVADVQGRHHHVRGPPGRPRLDRAQLGQPDTVGEAADVVHQATSGLQREPRLAHPGRAGEGHQPVVLEPGPDPGDCLVPADQLGERGGQVAAWRCRGGRCRRRGRPVERPVSGEHGAVQGHQVGPGIEAELVRKVHAEHLVRVQRLLRPPAPVEGAHVGGAQPFPQGVRGQQLGELGDQLGVLAEEEPGLGVVLQRGQPFLGQPGGGGPDERLVGEVREGRAAPQRQRVGQQRRPGARVGGLAGPRGQRPEPAGVHGVGVESQAVTRRRRRDEPPAALLRPFQRPAQLRHLARQRARRVAGKPLTPQRVDEPGGRHRSALVYQQDREQGADLPARHRDRFAAGRPHRHRAQHPEEHAGTVTRGHRRCARDMATATVDKPSTPSATVGRSQVRDQVTAS